MGLIDEPAFEPAYGYPADHDYKENAIDRANKMFVPPAAKAGGAFKPHKMGEGQYFGNGIKRRG